MESYTVILSPSALQTRALVRRGSDELLRAHLPPPSQVQHARAMRLFLEGLAALFDERLRVVLCVDVQQAACCLGLTDEWGLGQRSLYYVVEVRARRVRPRRGRRIRGVCDFADLRPTRLRSDAIVDAVCDAAPPGAPEE